MIIRGRADKDPRRESFNNTDRDRDRSPKIDDRYPRRLSRRSFRRKIRRRTVLKINRFFFLTPYRDSLAIYWSINTHQWNQTTFAIHYYLLSCVTRPYMGRRKNICQRRNWRFGYQNRYYSSRLHNSEETKAVLGTLRWPTVFGS